MSDIQFMQRALELARLGQGSVSPNPMVGCVIVHNGKIIAEGFHQKYGEAHAEVNAIQSVHNQLNLIESTVYVTLEPCVHHGKTPPCADLLVQKKIKKVVIANRDPFDQVDGKGIEKLKNAGVEVVLGIMGAEAIELNKRFFTFHQKKRPYVILKWAQTQDGFIARKNGDSKWISNVYSRQLAHKWRTEEDAILVGKNTVIADDPLLTSRHWEGKNPIRILLDRKNQAREDSNIFNQEAQTLILNDTKNVKVDTNQWIKLDDLNPKNILEKLFEKNIQSVIIEGGTQVLNSFIEANCWDEARVVISDICFGEGMKSPALPSGEKSKEKILNDLLTRFYNPNG